MSGIYCRTPYDDCYATEYNRLNRPYSDYPMFVEGHVNPSMANPKLQVCTHLHVDVSNCAVCSANQNATMTNMPEFFSQKVEIDSALRGVGRHLSYCNNNKFVPCSVKSDKRLPGECNNVINVTPLLCDRDITPTNMKMRF